MAGLYNGHLLEFPQIRVDCFTAHPNRSRPKRTLPHPLRPDLPHRPAPPAQLYLLTHVHSDHLTGLSDNFVGDIICSPDTKRMLLKLEAEKEREMIVQGVKERPKRKYEGLKARVEGRGTKDERIVDRIEAIPYGTPTVFELGYEDGEEVKVTITLLEANHCPGSTMFLITSPQYAVLHTGDVRADTLFRQSLSRNPAISQYLVPSHSLFVGSGKKPGQPTARRQLDRIYIDTSAIVGTGDMPDKESVIRDLIEIMTLYPDDAIFFFNVWCFGWEDVVKEVARNFDTLVHVDRYKHIIYKSVKSDPFLSACTTLDPTATRFHACDRFAKCDECIKYDRGTKRTRNRDKNIVNVHMVEVKSASWEMDKREYMKQLASAACGEGELPYTLEIPFARHSPLPELQQLTKMFRPKSLSPNTMVPVAAGYEYYLLPEYFKDCMSSEAHLALIAERDAWFAAHEKYGPAHLEKMKGASIMGMNDLQGMMADFGGEMIDIADMFRAPTMTGALQRGRRADAMDQMARATGLPMMSAGDLSSMFSAIGGPESMIGLSDMMAQGGLSMISGPGFGGLGDMGMPGRGGMNLAKMMGQGLPGCGGSRTMGTSPGSNQVGGREKKEAESYDTAESDVRSKRRKLYGGGDTASPVAAKTEVKVEPVQMAAKANSRKSLAIALDSCSTSPVVKKEIKTEVKVEASSPRLASPSSSVRATSSPAGPSKARHPPIKRFSLDKEHVRALARVAAEVDDLE